MEVAMRKEHLPHLQIQKLEEVRRQIPIKWALLES